MVEQYQLSQSGSDRVVRHRKIAAGSLWLVLVAITIGPGALRPQITDDPQFDRFIILSIVGAATALATVHHRAASAAAMLVAIATLEASQLLAVGRHAAVVDAIVKSMGAMTGCGIVWLLESVQARGRIIVALIAGTALSVVTAASWYVVSPGLALEHLRQALGRSDPMLPAFLDVPATKLAIVGVPGRPLPVDVWGRTTSILHMTVRSEDRAQALVVLSFERHGLRWQLSSVSRPHQRKSG